MIEIRGLAKSYGEHQALCDVSLSIRPGEFVVVLGPSGAGKSTLLRCINLLIEPSAGDIVVDGTSLSSNRRDLRLRLPGEVEMRPADRKAGVRARRDRAAARQVFGDV